MHVLLINKFFYEKGGTERYFFSLSRSLEARGHTVSYFAMRHPRNVESPFSRFFVSEKNYAKAGGRLEEIGAGVSFIRSRQAATNLSRLLRQFKPDVAHLHNIYHQITPSIIPVLERAKVPGVMTLHDYKLVCPNYSLFDGTAYCYRCRGGRFHRAAAVRCHDRSFAMSALLCAEAYWQKLTRVYDRVRFFIAPSRYVREVFLAEGYSADRVVYVAPFVSRSPSGGIASAAPSEEVEHLRLPARYIVYFGRLSPEKGLATLIDAVAALGDVPLVVCGDGPLRKTLEGRASARSSGRVQFTGHLARPVLEAVLQRAAAAVVPSEGPENAPFGALEAMAVGVPVVVSSMGGLPELVSSGGGVVFPAGNSAELAAKIRELWDDVQLASELGERGRRMMTEELTEKRHVDAIEAIYHRAAEAH